MEATHSWVAPTAWGSLRHKTTGYGNQPRQSTSDPGSDSTAAGIMVQIRYSPWNGRCPEDTGFDALQEATSRLSLGTKFGLSQVGGYEFADPGGPGVGVSWVWAPAAAAAATPLSALAAPGTLWGSMTRPPSRCLFWLPRFFRGAGGKIFTLLTRSYPKANLYREEHGWVLLAVKFLEAGAGGRHSGGSGLFLEKDC